MCFKVALAGLDKGSGSSHGEDVLCLTAPPRDMPGVGWGVLGVQVEQQLRKLLWVGHELRDNAAAQVEKLVVSCFVTSHLTSPHLTRRTSQAKSPSKGPRRGGSPPCCVSSEAVEKCWRQCRSNPNSAALTARCRQLEKLGIRMVKPT